MYSLTLYKLSITVLSESEFINELSIIIEDIRLLFPVARYLSSRFLNRSIGLPVMHAPMAMQEIFLFKHAANVSVFVQISTSEESFDTLFKAEFNAEKTGIPAPVFLHKVSISFSPVSYTHLTLPTTERV